MQAYTEILPPSAVSHAVCLPLVDSSSQTLVVAKTSLLQLFQAKDFDASAVGYQSNGLHPSNSNGGFHKLATGQKLHLLTEYQLSGTVTSLAAIKTVSSKSGGHVLLIAFRDAKLSLVEWDPESFGLVTISLHLYEGEDLQTKPWSSNASEYTSKLLVDPGSRCAALRHDGQYLAILPIRHHSDDLVMDDFEHDMDHDTSNRKSSVTVNGSSDSNQKLFSSSFVLPLRLLDPELIHPIDLAFLHEYREPTLGILSSSVGSAFALLQQRKDAITYKVFTLDIDQHASTPLLAVAGLPSDLSQVVPLPLPIGGALLVGGNEIIHVDQAGKAHAVGVNDFARQCSSFAMLDQSDLHMRLEGCEVQPIGLASGEVVIVLQSGELVTLSFKMDGRSIAGLAVQRVPPEKGGGILRASASCIAQLDGEYIFVGSSEGDSSLIHCGQQRTGLARKRSRAEALGVEAATSDEDLSEDEDEDDLYGDNTASTKRNTASVSTSTIDNLRFAVSDTLRNLSSSGEPVFIPDNHAHSLSTNQSGQLIQSPTSRQSTLLKILQRQLRPQSSADLNQDSIKDIWAVSQTWPAEPTAPSDDPGADRDGGR